MHVQVRERPAQPTLEPQVFNMQTTASDDTAGQSGFEQAAAVAAAEDAGAPAPVQAAPSAKPQTVVKDAFDKTPRNAPCPCGSGKKFKQCHGAA
jgi:preprotein translocase subunit SecA